MAYTVSVQRSFIAQHYLIGGDWGAENKLHSHHYRVELLLEGDSLDQHGYLVDIVEMEDLLEALESRFADRTLNDLPEFSGLNPSLEHFARILGQDLGGQIEAPNVSLVTVKIWENDIAWASYQMEQ